METKYNHEKRTKIVVYLTAIMMVVEITFGISTKSMALLADGIHMASHVGALGLSWAAYWLIRKHSNNPKFTSGTGKILSLSGFTSGLILQIFAILIVIESIDRLINPVKISFREAIVVAVFGLIVNIVCAMVLHHDKKHSDHNIRAAYLHVLADAITSLTAIIAIAGAMYYKINSLDVIGGLVSAIIITKWSWGLLKVTSLELLDYTNDKKIVNHVR